MKKWDIIGLIFGAWAAILISVAVYKLFFKYN
jgi:hypothetical protein